MNKALLEFKHHFYSCMGESAGMGYSCWFKFWPNIVSADKSSEALAMKDLEIKVRARIHEIETEAKILKNLLSDQPVEGDLPNGK